jgi:hypothetical protein
MSGFHELTTLLKFQKATTVFKKEPFHMRFNGNTEQTGTTWSGLPELIGTKEMGQSRFVSSLASRFIDLSAPPPESEFVTIITRDIDQA